MSALPAGARIPALSKAKASIAAAGTDAATATPITSVVNTVDTSLADAGVLLPPIAAAWTLPNGGYQPAGAIVIYNAGPNPLNVYPTSSDSAPILNVIPPFAAYEYSGASGGDWWSGPHGP